MFLFVIYKSRWDELNFVWCCLSFIGIQNSHLFENLFMVSFFGFLLGGYNCSINIIKFERTQVPSLDGLGSIPQIEIVLYLSIFMSVMLHPIPMLHIQD